MAFGYQSQLGVKNAAVGASNIISVAINVAATANDLIAGVSGYAGVDDLVAGARRPSIEKLLQLCRIGLGFFDIPAERGRVTDRQDPSRAIASDRIAAQPVGVGANPRPVQITFALRDELYKEKTAGP